MVKSFRGINCFYKRSREDPIVVFECFMWMSLVFITFVKNSFEGIIPSIQRKILIDSGMCITKKRESPNLSLFLL